MTLTIDTLVLGALETNCYVLREAGDCWVVDPGMDPGPLMKFLARESAAVSRIVLTHGHGDHIAGAGEVKAAYSRALVTCPAGDAWMLTDPQGNLSAPFGFSVTCPPADELIAPGQTLVMGQGPHPPAPGRSGWRVLDTSGHTPGGVSLYCPAAEAVLTGDALFAGGIGRTDIPGGSASRLLRNIREQLLALPDATGVLPGHGPATSVGRERRTNPFFAQ